MAEILSIGDCNTLGTGEADGRSYPEILGERLGKSVRNCGFTMSTTREGLNMLRDSFDPGVEILTLQFGLVDSWRTFRYAPYVLYYPDNTFRKISRKVVKKYKKICRNIGCNSIFGESFLVNADEYEKNLRAMIEYSLEASEKSVRVFLIDTVPNRDIARNEHIIKYNLIMSDIAADYPQVEKVDIYQYFVNDMDRYYQDNTHLNSAGYELIASKIERVFFDGE